MLDSDSPGMYIVGFFGCCCFIFIVVPELIDTLKFLQQCSVPICHCSVLLFKMIKSTGARESPGQRSI